MYIGAVSDVEHTQHRYSTQTRPPSQNLSRDHLCHYAKKGDLTDVRALASHVWAGADLHPRGADPSPQTSVVAHVGVYEGVQDRVATLGDVQLRWLFWSCKFRAGVPAIKGVDHAR